MSRLTKRNNKGYVGIKGYHGLLTSYCYECTEELEDGVYLLEDALNKLAEYEDLEEQGLLLRLPCKVGDTLYIIEPSFYNCEKHEGVQIGACKSYAMDDNYGWVVKVKLEEGEKYTLYYYEFSKFGKTVFLTREEAEQKLKEVTE